MPDKRPPDLVAGNDVLTAAGRMPSNRATTAAFDADLRRSPGTASRLDVVRPLIDNVTVVGPLSKNLAEGRFRDPKAAGTDQPVGS